MTKIRFQAMIEQDAVALLKSAVDYFNGMVLMGEILPATMRDFVSGQSKPVPVSTTVPPIVPIKPTGTADIKAATVSSLMTVLKNNPNLPVDKKNENNI